MITADEIATLMQTEFTPAQTAAAELYIELAIGEIEAYLGRPVTIREFTDNVYPDYNGTIFLRETPVVTIESITVNGEVVADDHFTFTPYGLTNIFENTWRYKPITANTIDINHLYEAELTVSYTAGLDFPAAVKALVASAVIRALRTGTTELTKTTLGASGARRIQVQDFQIEYERVASSSVSGGTSALSLFGSIADFATIERYKKRVIG